MKKVSQKILIILQFLSFVKPDSVNCPNNGQCKPLCDGMDLGQPSSICTSNLKRHDSNSANLSTNLDRKNKQTDTDIK